MKKKGSKASAPAGRPKSGSASGSLREGLSSPFPIMRAAAEQIIRAALREPKWKAVATRLGLHIRSLEDLRRDFPQIDEWREIERGDVDSD